MIRIKCTLKEPASQEKLADVSFRFDEPSQAADFYTRARLAGYEPEVVEGREHFQAMLPEVQR